MADTLGWRLKLGVLVPSTNTSVQPEHDAMRPPGVTNHVRGFRIPNAPTRTDAEFCQQFENMRATMGRLERRALRACKSLPDEGAARKKRSRRKKPRAAWFSAAAAGPVKKVPATLVPRTARHLCSQRRERYAERKPLRTGFFRLLRIFRTWSERGGNSDGVDSVGRSATPGEAERPSIFRLGLSGGFRLVRCLSRLGLMVTR